MTPKQLKDKEGKGNEVFALEGPVKVDATFHERMEAGSAKGRMLSDLTAAEIAMQAGVPAEVAWRLCAGPELRAMG